MGWFVLTTGVSSAADTLEITARHFRKMDSIDDRFNQQANDTASKFTAALTTYLGGKGEYPSNLSREFYNIEKKRRDEMSEVQKEFVESKSKVMEDVGKRRQTASASGTRGKAALGKPGAASKAVSGAAAPAQRETEVIDGSNVEKEVEFKKGEGQEAKPAIQEDSQNGAQKGAKDGVGEITF